MIWMEKEVTCAIVQQTYVVHFHINIKRNTFMIWWILDKRQRNKNGTLISPKRQTNIKNKTKNTQSIGTTNWWKNHRFPPRHHIARCRRWAFFLLRTKKPKAVPFGGAKHAPLPTETPAVKRRGWAEDCGSTLFDADAEGKKIIWNGTILKGKSILRGIFVSFQGGCPFGKNPNWSATSPLQGFPGHKENLQTIL